MIKIDINDLDKYFQKGELIPAIAFDVDTKTVLMLAYMNRGKLTENTGNRIHMVLEPFQTGTLEQGCHQRALTESHFYLQRLRQ